jgi:hypothetical protein
MHCINHCLRLGKARLLSRSFVCSLHFEQGIILLVLSLRLNAFVEMSRLRCWKTTGCRNLCATQCVPERRRPSVVDSMPSISTAQDSAVSNPHHRYSPQTGNDSSMNP